MKRAFTLIELVVSISIILIILSIGIFSLKSSKYYKARKDLDRLVLDLRYTRNLAISNNNSSRFKFNSGNSYTISCGDIIQKNFYSKDLQISGRIPEELKFTRNGASSKDTAQTLHFKINDKLFEVTIEPVTGKVNLKK